ncbi:MAG: Gfo/Idh/MocA family oxidoreductase, partial [Lentisphaerae bacterium]|nr:Gfo/Idh/MocA family oxidoreductase [Lentisphaerota bacterium]
MSDAGQLSRRSFLRSGTAAAAATALGAGKTMGQEAGATARIGIVGVGSRGTHLLRTMLQFPGVQVPAVCDIVASHAKRAQDIVEKATGTRPEPYTNGERDWERLIARDDLDAVVAATPWEWHTPIMVGSMRAGKIGGTEVPAALTVEECWELVRTFEETGVPCMMLENLCYFSNALALLRMVREGVFGELLHAEAGYQHDCRYLMFRNDGTLTWRGKHAAASNGNLYPTHPIGPVAQWFNINRGDRFTTLSSVSSKAVGLKRYAAAKFGKDHPLATREYALGDVNTCLLQTEAGLTVTLYFDLNTPRPYDLILRLQGTNGIHMGGKIHLEGKSPKAHTYEPFATYANQYAHPLWAELQQAARKHGGHGGSDYVMMYDFLKAVKNRTPFPQDVYDAATWSVITPLSMASVARGG